jgi:hypothetical protein
MINLETVRQNVQNAVSEQIGGEIRYRRLGISYFPRPHVVIHKVDITIPDSFTINMYRMKIYPRILPLFWGRLQADAVILEYADYFMELPQITRGEPLSGQPASFDAIVKAIYKAIQGLPEFKLPQLNLVVKYGKINLVDPLGRKFKLSEVQASYRRRPKNLDFFIKCKSNLWDQIDVKGSLNPLSFEGKGHIRLSQFRPQALMAYLLHDSTLQVTDTRANFSIDLTLDGTGNLKAAIDGGIPLLALRRGPEDLLIKGGRIRCTAHIGNGKVEISLKELGLDFPRLQATGGFTFDESRQDIQLIINGSRIDAASVRQAATGILGESETIQKIFKVIRGGFVPWMTVRIQGRDISDLGRLNNIVIKGRMTQGKIFIPGVELDLVNVVGDALISNGILNGESLAARMGNSIGSNGNMVLGLNRDIAPFHLKIDIAADLAQLPPVLDRVIRDNDFLAELALIQNVKGTAQGTLTLGDDLAGLKAEVQASNVNLTARYHRIPYPVKLNGGKFYYGGKRLSYEDFHANIGKSSMTDCSIAVDWTATASLSAGSQSAKFGLSELYTWLVSFERFKNNLGDIRLLKGDIATTNLKIKGPFFKPSDWLFQTSGVVNKLILNSKKLAKPVQINRGQFTWQGTEMSFSGVDATMGKSTIDGISGDVNWTQAPVFSTRSGRAIFHFADIRPFIFLDRSTSKALGQLKPVGGSLSFKNMTASGPLSQLQFGKVFFSGDIEKLKVDAKGLPGPVQISRGNISWHRNRLELKKFDAEAGKSAISQFSAVFKLNKSHTFEVQAQSVMVAANEVYPWLLSFDKFKPFLKDFAATKGFISMSGLIIRGPLHNPAQWQSAVTGNIQNLGLTSDAFGGPLTVNNGSFHLTSETETKSVRNKIRVDEMDLTWGQNHFTLVGGCTTTREDIFLDLAIAADAIDWRPANSLVEFIVKKTKDPNSGLVNKNVTGNLQIRADNFYFETYAASPLIAEIRLEPDETVISINRAVVCNISIQGQLKLTAQTLDVSLVPAAANQMLAATLSCFTDQSNLAMGTFDLSGQLWSKGRPVEFPRSVAGEMAFSATNGRIYRFGLLAKILSILNVTEIYRGEIPDLVGEGFAYRSMTIGAELEKGKLILSECSIDGVSMGIACEGDIDLAEKKMDLIILVAPFKTVDRIIKFLPLIKQILGGKLISIPFRAKGQLKNPAVIPLHPTAVGSGLLGVLERTIKLPITIMQPVFSTAKSKKSPQDHDNNRDPTGAH